jgi:hypothetical protein
MAAWLALLNPVVLIHVISGVHNDALMAGLLLAALLVTSVGERGYLAALAVGVLVGLAVGVKATALLALPFLALLTTRDHGWWPVIRTGLITGLVTVGTYGVLWTLTGYGLGWIGALRDATPRVVEATSLSTGVGLVVAHTLKVSGYPDLARQAVGAVRGLGLLVVAAIVVVLWLRARRRGETGHVVVATGLAWVASVLLAPIVFPWYALTAIALLGYGLTDDRIRYRVALLVAPTILLILPNGNGLGAIFRRPGSVLDTLLVLAAAVFLSLRYVRRRWAAAREHSPQPASHR